MEKKTFLYRDAGETFVKLIKPLAQHTFTPGVKGDIDGFAALFAPDLSEYKSPVLVATTDGVGMVIVAKPEEAEKISEEAWKLGEEPFIAGEIVAGEGLEIV